MAFIKSFPILLITMKDTTIKRLSWLGIGLGLAVFWYQVLAYLF
jgi:hypothetical protein